MAYESVSKQEQANETMKERATKYVQEFESWKTDLKPYWPQIDKNQEMYEFYKREASETSSDVSLNTPFSLIESQVAKMNETTLNVTAQAKGHNGMTDFEEYISSVLKGAIEDPDVAMYHGTFRKKKEMFTREFLVKGNAVAEVQYCYKTAIIDGEKQVLADNPYVEIMNYQSYIFNPAYQFDSSPVQYLEKYVSLDYLKSQEYKEEPDEDDKKSTRKRGIYTNLNILQDELDGKKQVHDHEDQRFISGDTKLARKVEPIRLLERWEGAKLCVIANDSVIIREAYDPKKIGGSGILTAMNYKLEGRPYAYGEIDAIYKSVRAQDTVLNQSIEMVNKFLRPGILVSDLDADLDAIIEVMEAGGVTYGNAQGVTVIPTNTPPPAAFQTIDSLQQAIERAARFSPYAVGVPSQETDQTQGTLGGIARLQQAAEPNFQVKIDAIQDSFARPLAMYYLKSIGRLMDSDEIRYGFLQSKGKKWVMATKGILMGKPTIEDLLTIEMITPEEVPNLLAELGIELDPMQDPYALLQEIVFDVDWVIDVKLDNQSAADRFQKAQQEMSLIQMGMQMGVQFSPDRVIMRQAQKQGFDDIDELLLTDEEMAQQQQMQQEQMMREQQEADNQRAHEAAMREMEIDAQMRQTAMQNQSAMGIEQMRQQSQLAGV